MNRLAVLLVLGLCLDAGALSVTAGGEYLDDNTVFDRKTLSLSFQGMAAWQGEWEIHADVSRSRFEGEICGLTRFEDDAFHTGLGYHWKKEGLSASVTLDAGAWALEPGKRAFVSASVPLKWQIPGSRLKLLSMLGFRSGTADDNPAAARIGIGKRTLEAEVGVGFRDWEMHALYRTSRYDAVNRKEYRSLLADTLFFETFYDILNPALKLISAQTAPIPSNEIREGSVFLFGPLIASLYGGASFTSNNSEADYYIPMADSSSGAIVFSHFPFITPRNEGVLHLILAYSGNWQGAARLVNEASCKLSFPAYSYGTYRGYYQFQPGNLLAGFNEFYYDYHGLGTLHFDAEVGKTLGRGISFKIRYDWESRPYVAYGFFGDNAYAYHTFKLECKKAW